MEIGWSEIQALLKKYLDLYDKYKEGEEELDEWDEITMNEIIYLNQVWHRDDRSITSFFKVLELVVENEERK